MSEQLPTNNGFEAVFDVRYKDGKVDQISLKIMAAHPTYDLLFSKETLIGMLDNIQMIFKDMPMKKGTDVLTIETFCTHAIERLKKE